VSGDAVNVVARLKEQSEVPLRSHGSPSLNRALMAARLVDFVQVTLFPVITGQTGLDPIFQNAADFDPELVESGAGGDHWWPPEKDFEQGVGARDRERRQRAAAIRASNLERPRAGPLPARGTWRQSTASSAPNGRPRRARRRPRGALGARSLAPLGRSDHLAEAGPDANARPRSRRWVLVHYPEKQP
jgi:hypothetical protein